MRFIYFNHEKGKVKHPGITCVGYTYDKEKKQLKFAISQCSPKDRFSKKLARKMITGRFRNNKRCFIIPDIEVSHGDYKEPKYKDCIDIISKYINNLLSHQKEGGKRIFPQWFEGI